MSCSQLAPLTTRSSPSASARGDPVAQVVVVHQPPPPTVRRAALDRRLHGVSRAWRKFVSAWIIDGDQHDEEDRNVHVGRQEVVGVLVDLAAEAVCRREHLGDDDADPRGRERLPRAGDDVRRRRRDDDRAQDLTLVGAEALARRQQLGVDVLDAGHRVDDHREDRGQEHVGEAELEVEAEPERPSPARTRRAASRRGRRRTGRARARRRASGPSRCRSGCRPRARSGSRARAPACCSRAAEDRVVHEDLVVHRLGDRASAARRARADMCRA